MSDRTPPSKKLHSDVRQLDSIGAKRESSSLEARPTADESGR
jgi:hypothetical protein